MARKMFRKCYFFQFFKISQLLQLTVHGNAGHFTFGKFIYQANVVAP